jgi:hypothetical protein
MKSIIAILSSTAVISGAVLLNGQSLDAVVLFSILASSCVVGLFVTEYSRPRASLLAVAPKRQAAPARQATPAHAISAVAEFATLTGFDTFAA